LDNFIVFTTIVQRQKKKASFKNPMKETFQLTKEHATICFQKAESLDHLPLSPPMGPPLDGHTEKKWVQRVTITTHDDCPNN